MYDLDYNKILTKLDASEHFADIKNIPFYLYKNELSLIYIHNNIAFICSINEILKNAENIKTISDIKKISYFLSMNDNIVYKYVCIISDTTTEELELSSSFLRKLKLYVMSEFF